MNPYSHLPPENFWRSGVSNYAQLKTPFQNLWKPKFPVTPSTKFITAGSCFAQHISKWLKSSGYTWLNSELGDPSAKQSENEKNGYGIFSFRTGNIYTPKLLRQWVEQSLGTMRPLEEIFEKDNIFYDPFRPSIPPQGYNSIMELRSAQTATLSAIKSALIEADVFIFTLGLTEAWEHKDGYVYAQCPGTLAGTYDKNLHHFINYSYDQIIDDLEATFNAIKKFNPKIKFLLTVSPVPLTATASNHHVFSATTFSKSILRAAAGQLEKNRVDVDYFPSYELISQFPTRGIFYEDNLRSVKSNGVEYVMEHFSNGIKADQRNDNLKIKTPSQDLTAGLDEYCDDILLDAWNSNNKVLSHQSASLLLLGDSHFGHLSEAFRQLGIPFVGGGIMRGHKWAENAFLLDEEEIFIPLDKSFYRRQWSETHQLMIECTSKTKIAITNLGLQTWYSVPQIYNEFIAQQKNSISNEEIKNLIFKMHDKKIKIIQELVKRGYLCIIPTDPPIQELNEQMKNILPLFVRYEEVICKMYEEMGCIPFNVRDHFGTQFKKDYFPSHTFHTGIRDWIHASNEYYTDLAKALVCRITQLSQHTTL
jgi:GSCFA family